ncbi:PE-PPE domain-containing protein [Mycolicibacterium sp.]|uniref:PE-PPE domain-containing protein n=1 Tax=Mycolicibacterium sp. TaxID=2320850 RepID=UPI0028ADE6DE|nr:PE-PPE domain-containing protein [Mycolicibacterium sp.]
MALRRNVLAAIVAIPTAALLVAAPAWSVTALTVSGTRGSEDPPFPEQLVPGYFAGDTVARIDYPAALIGMDKSIAVAAAGIVAGIADTVGPLVVAGFSQGAVAVGYAKQALMELPPEQRPDPELLSFLTIGDPSGPGGIFHSLLGRVPVIELTPFIPPDTPYRSVTVNGEYDGWADYPDRPTNLLSVVNALLGTVYVHGRYETIPGGLDLAAVPLSNITTVVNGAGGSTTGYLVPTDKLPLVQPLRDIGIPEPVVAAIEKPLKAIVDGGYSRNDAPDAVAVVPRSATSLRAVDSEPDADSEPEAQAGPGGRNDTREPTRRHRTGRGSGAAA